MNAIDFFSNPRLRRKTPSSARERAILSPGKDGEAGDVGFIVDTAGCSQAGQLRLPLSDSGCVSSENSQSKGPLEARSGFPTEPKATELPNDKEMWIQKYAVRILIRFQQCKTPLGVANTYLARLKEDLAVFYDDPLKRLSIEASY